jgi:hypothetical protein
MRPNRLKLKLKFIACISLQIGLIFFTRVNALAEMSSASFNIGSDAIGIGGGRSTSGSYILEGTIGEVGATEDTSSASFKLCAGFQCFSQESFLSFSIKEGLVAPGAVGAGVGLGELSPTAVSSSNGVDINSIFISADSSSGSGTVISVKSLNGALKSVITSGSISSSSKTLGFGTAGYGVCVGSAVGLSAAAPYDGACNSGAGHVVGIVDGTARTILTSPSLVLGGTAEILVKAAVSETTPGAPDFSDTLTFILSSTY